MLVAGRQVTTDQLRAAQRRFNALPRELKGELRKAQRDQLGPIWKDELARANPGGQFAVIFRTGNRVKAGLPIQLVAGAGTRRMRGGGQPVALARGFEFGTDRRNSLTRYKRRNKHSHTIVTRHSARQLPEARRAGRMVFPALDKTVPQVKDLWANAILTKIIDAVEGH